MSTHLFEAPLNKFASINMIQQDAEKKNSLALIDMCKLRLHAYGFFGNYLAWGENTLRSWLCDILGGRACIKCCEIEVFASEPERVTKLFLGQVLNVC